MSKSKSLDTKITDEQIIDDVFEQEFKRSSGRIYNHLIELHISEIEARRWYFKPNTYLNGSTPHAYCENKECVF